MLVLPPLALSLQDEKLYFWLHSSFCYGVEKFDKYKIDGSHKVRRRPPPPPTPPSHSLAQYALVLI